MMVAWFVLGRLTTTENAFMNDVNQILMWEKMVRSIGARLERQKNALADTELQYTAAQKGLADARAASSQKEMPLKGGK